MHSLVQYVVNSAWFWLGKNIIPPGLFWMQITGFSMTINVAKIGVG